MKIAITGAGGFIGREVVNEALRQKCDVVALVRKRKANDFFVSQDQNTGSLDQLECDLLEAAHVNDAVKTCDCVIHLAAVMEGSNQYHDTLQATENILRAMDREGIKKLVACSSIAVFDYVSVPPLQEINEQTPISHNKTQLGPYALMKRDQEILESNWNAGDKRVITLRPGLVYSEERLPNHHVGFKILGARHEGQVPLVHLMSAAKGFVAAATLNIESQSINLVNDELPTQDDYINRLKEKNALGASILFPWKLYALLLACFRIPLSLINKVPDALRKNSIAGRQKPFRFSNSKAKELLHWQPKSGLTDS